MTKNGQSAKLRPADRPPHILMVWEFSFFGLWSPSGSLANATASDGSATLVHPTPSLGEINLAMPDRSDLFTFRNEDHRP